MTMSGKADFASISFAPFVLLFVVVTRNVTRPKQPWTLSDSGGRLTKSCKTRTVRVSSVRRRQRHHQGAVAAVVAAGSCPPFVMAVEEVGPREGEEEAEEAGEAGEQAGEEVEEVAWEQQSAKLQRFAVLKSV